MMKHTLFDRILSMLLCAAMILSCLAGVRFPMTAAATEATPEGSLTSDDGKWSFTAYGDGAQITAYHGNAADVYIPAILESSGTKYPVCLLSDGLFADQDGLNSVTLGEGIREIGKQTFYDCDNLVCIVTNESLTTIGAEAFSGCDAFNSVVLYDNIQTIGKNAFADCPKLTIWCNENTAGHIYAVANSIPCEIINAEDLPETVTENGVTYYVVNGTAIAIDYDESDTDVTIPSTANGFPVTELRGTFRDCKNLLSISLPASLCVIGDFAFYNCSGLQSVILPQNTVAVGSQAFLGCTSLKEILLPDYLNDLHNDSFSANVVLHVSQGSLTHAVVKETDLLYVPYVGQPGKILFQGDITYCVVDGSAVAIACDPSATQAELPTTVEGYPVTATLKTFLKCINLTKVSLPEGLITIGEKTFENCIKLEDVNIPESVKEIGTDAFAFCHSITNLSLPDGVEQVREYAFRNCYNLTGVYFGKGITDLENSAFIGCNKIDSIIFEGNAPQNIAAGAFFGIECTVYYPQGQDSWQDIVVHQYGGSIVWQSYQTEVDSTIIATGTCGAAAQWSLTEYGVLTISGSGAMSDFSSSTIPWKTHKDVIKKIVIKEGITTVGNSSFSACSNVTTVQLANSITQIGTSAFSGCTNLTNIDLPEKLTYLSDNLFYNCKSLSSIIIPAGVTQIGRCAFESCTALKEVVIPDTVSQINQYAFRSCKNLIRITIPANVTEIKSYTFSNCTNLRRVNFRGSLKRLWNYAFSDCKALAVVAFYAGPPRTIDASAFSNVSASVYYPSKNAASWETGGSYGGSLLQQYGGKLNWVKFEGELSAITVATGTCGESATWSFSEDGILTISGTGKMDDYKWTFTGENAVYPPWWSYKDSILQVMIEDGITGIGDYAFYTSKLLHNVVIPGSVTDIGAYAFSGCAALNQLALVDGLLTIGSHAFFECENITAVTLPDTLQTIEDGAFQQCYALTEAVIPAQVKRIGASAFSTCRSITKLTMPDTLEVIGNSAFSYCTGLTHVKIPLAVTELIGTFAYCRNLVDVTMHDGITCIDSAFKSCERLSSIDIPEGIKTLGGFSYCSSLTSIYIPEGVEILGDFRSCSKLTSITIPKSVKEIQSYAFSDCTGLRRINIKGAPQRIWLSAFARCTALEAIVFENAPPRIIDTEAFFYVTSNAYYPKAYSASWNYSSPVTRNPQQDYGGKLTWMMYEGKMGSMVIASGICGSNVQWSLTDDGTLRIFGSGAVDSYTSPENCPWYEYRHFIQHIILEDGLVAIGDNAFNSLRNLNDIRIAESVTTIGKRVFADCVKLRSIEIPQTITTIGDEAFFNCQTLRFVWIPETVANLGANVFDISSVLVVKENTYAHNYALDNNCLFFVIHKPENPEISFGASITGTVGYTDGTAAICAAVDILYPDGTIKETVTTDTNGVYAFTYAEVGAYTLRATDSYGNTATTQLSVKRMNAFDVFLSGDPDMKLKKSWTVSGTVNGYPATVSFTDQEGNILHTTQTSDGNFSFANISNGTYLLTATTETGSASQEVTVFDGNVSGITLMIEAATVTLWGYVEAESRDLHRHPKSWVKVTLYDADGIALSQTRSDKNGAYLFENLPTGAYTIVAEANEMRPDHAHGYDRNHLLTGCVYIAADTAGTYHVETLILREQSEQRVTISGKVTAQGEHQQCEVVLVSVFCQEIARYATGKNGKYTFSNIPDGMYIITATTQSNGMGFTAVAVRNGEVFGQTDISVAKTDKITEREAKFQADLAACLDQESAAGLRDRIAEEKRFYDALSQKEKKQLSTAYVEQLNQLVEWVANCQIFSDDGISVEQAGLIISGDELEQAQTVTFSLHVSEANAHNPGIDGVQTDADFIHHELQDKAAGKEISQYYEITMTKTVDGLQQPITSVCKDTDATGKFRITMEIPSEYRGHKHYSFLHIHCGEVLELTDLDDDPNTVTFEVDRFSTFALTYTDTELTRLNADIEVHLADGSIYYSADSADAIDKHLTQADSYLFLKEDGLTVDIPAGKTVYMDLNGKTVTVTGSGTLCGMDSANDSYAPSTGKAAVAQSVTVQTAVVGGANSYRYISLPGENGTVTFHRVNIRLSSVTLRPSAAGIYYTGQYEYDAAVAACVATYGTTLSVNNPTPVADGSDPSCIPTTDTYSTLLKNIMAPRNTESRNRKNAEIPVYGRAYLKLKDGTCIYSAAVSTDLKTLVETVDATRWEYLTALQKDGLAELYRRYQPIMEEWSIENLKQFATQP